MHIGSYTSNMHSYIERYLTNKIQKRLTEIPAVAILGARQVGKSTLAKKIISKKSNAVYLDLERTSDLNKLRDPETFFSINKSKFICLDEIQKVPELFSTLRSVIDEHQRNGQFLILGSASRDLIQQSSESLAGRIAYVELPPFQQYEVKSSKFENLWLRGGFPRSYLAKGALQSLEWRNDFIHTYLERDIPALGIKISAPKLERFWRMCAHSHGQILNLSKLGASLGVSHHTVRSYVDILEQTFLLRTLQPYWANVKKRLVKSPKIYMRDSGILHALLDIDSHNHLLGHPIYGESWEGFVIEQILTRLQHWQGYFYRTAAGNEIDLILEKGRELIAVEIKASSAPTVSKGFYNSIEDLGIDKAFIIAHVKHDYPYEQGVQVVSLESFLSRVESSKNVF